MDNGYKKIQETIAELNGWVWMNEKHNKSNLNGVLKGINLWLIGNHPDFKLDKLWDGALGLYYEDNYSITRFNITKYNVQVDAYYTWNGGPLDYQLADIVHYITKALIKGTNDSPYHSKVKELKDLKKKLIQDNLVDFYLDMVDEGEWNTTNGNHIWYRNKKYTPTRVTFSNFSKTGKTCEINLYDGEELLVSMKRYSLMVFSESNYYWLYQELEKYCEQIDE